MQNQAPSGFPGRQTLREAFMLGGMGAAFSKDVPRALRQLAWPGRGGLAARMEFMEQVWKGFVLVP